MAFAAAGTVGVDNFTDGFVEAAVAPFAFCVALAFVDLRVLPAASARAAFAVCLRRRRVFETGRSNFFAAVRVVPAFFDAFARAVPAVFVAFVPEAPAAFAAAAAAAAAGMLAGRAVVASIFGKTGTGNGSRARRMGGKLFVGTVRARPGSAMTL